MNKMFTILSLALSCSIAGCSTIALKDFNRGPATDEQFERDGAECEMQAETGASRQLGTFYYQGRFNKFFQLCMRSKGYKK